MIALLFCAAAAAVYLRAVHLYGKKFPGHEYSGARVAAFLSGTLLLAIAFSPPLDRAVEGSFAVHMAQHIVLWLIAPALILLGAPLLLAVAVPSPGIARKLTGFANSRAGHALFSPLTAWLAYVFVLWGAHFTPLYEVALENPAVHVAEHALFLVVSFLFWGTVVQSGYAPRPVAYPVRMFFLFFAIPQGAFLGFALNASQHVLYRAYLRHFGDAGAALADQRNGADLMWIAGGLILFVAFMCTAAAWAASERRVAAVS